MLISCCVHPNLSTNGSVHENAMKLFWRFLHDPNILVYQRGKQVFLSRYLCHLPMKGSEARERCLLRY